jgi:pimeloyl-ACP methyl ester carboxylesterase
MPIREGFFEVAGGSLYVRDSAVERPRLSVLFLHGLGDSALSFGEAFERLDLPGVRLVAPDLLGYGRSVPGRCCDYRFEAQIRRLWGLVDRLRLGRLCLVGHSMGGDLATLMASSDSADRIAGVINIEGNLTSHDTFISCEVQQAHDQGRFPRWFSDFRERTVRECWSHSWPSCRRYYASLCLCRPEAFLANGLEICARNQPRPRLRPSRLGEAFADLSIPKLFCWGRQSLHARTQEYLRLGRIPECGFDDAFHWPMIDAAEELYNETGRFLRALLP